MERVQCRATKFILGDYSMDYKSRLTMQSQAIASNGHYELTDILFAIKSFKKHTSSFDISQYYNLMNQQLDLPTLSFVIRFIIPSLLILIFVGYPDYGMLYQS